MRGEAPYFLDDDDVVLMHGLATAWRLPGGFRPWVFVSVPEPFGTQHPDIVASEIAFYAPAKALFAGRISAADLAARLIFRDAVPTTSSCMLKRAVFESIGGFDESLTVAEDLDFYSRAIAQSGYVYGANAIARRRVGQASLIAQTEREQLNQAYAQMRAGFRLRQGLLNYVKYRMRHGLHV